MPLESSVKFAPDAFPPPDPRRYLDSEMSLHTYATYVKGILGPGRWGHACKSQRRLQSSDKCKPFSKLLFLLFIRHKLYNYNVHVFV